MTLYKQISRLLAHKMLPPQALYMNDPLLVIAKNLNNSTDVRSLRRADKQLHANQGLKDIQSELNDIESELEIAGLPHKQFYALTKLDIPFNNHNRTELIKFAEDTADQFKEKTPSEINCLANTKREQLSKSYNYHAAPGAHDMYLTKREIISQQQLIAGCPIPQNDSMIQRELQARKALKEDGNPTSDDLKNLEKTIKYCKERNSSIALFTTNPKVMTNYYRQVYDNEMEALHDFRQSLPSEMSCTLF